MTDVPCSGDGTIRKDSSILPRWNPGISNRLHPLQVSPIWREGGGGG
jgi:multisite-specific tRNA:(cytosine-C5)-methyltransferase